MRKNCDICDKTIKDNSEQNKDYLNETLQNFNSEWSDQHEKILVEWADKAICYRWLHAKSRSSYSFKNAWFTIPVIIMSTLTGTANFAQERIPDNHKALYSIIVGSVNIFAGILTTIQQFLKINEFSESHRVSSISWDKFYRNIKLELAKSRTERIPAYQMLKISKEEFDRLMETSPYINHKIICKFNTTFSGGPIKKGSELTKKQTTFKELHKPEICDELVSTEETRFKLAPNEVLHETIDPTIELNEIKKKYELISISFVQNFANINGREPTYIEYTDGISKTIPQEFINKELYNTSVRELKGPVIA